MFICILKEVVIKVFKNDVYNKINFSVIVLYNYYYIFDGQVYYF